MEQNYEQAPSIITGKDLDYLSDMFEWNYGALKKTESAIRNVEDDAIYDLLSRASVLFNNNMNSVLSMLNKGGNNE